MLIPILLFAVGLIVLVKGGDWFVDGATGIAHRFHLPEILIGATVVSVGTTLPEVMVSATSAFSGHGEMAYGNAIGSIICNTALVAAVTVAVRPGKVERKALKLPVIFFFIAAAFYIIVAYLFGCFTRTVGLVLLGLFTVYTVLSVLETRKASRIAQPFSEEQQNKNENTNKNLIKEIFLLAAGVVMIAVGAELLVDNGTVIAEGLGVPESVIALTFIALGTSLPELVTAITALAKGHNDLSLGNVIGANFFNLALVGGVSALVSPFSVPVNTEIAGINSTLLIDIPVMLLAMAFLTLPALKNGKLSRAQGIVLLGVYIAFCIVQFVI